MINKQANNERALAAKAIAEKYNLTTNISALNEFVKANDDYVAHILMIGGFSAGKSALLNKYIGKPVLAESIKPETDIATEIHFSENERIVAVLNDGTKKTISSKGDVDLQETSHLEHYVDSENVKTHCDYIMVDTPGADSGIEKHHKALMQYLGYGTAFFVVVDCEKGTITEGTLNFIDEVLNYSSDIAFIINKCDKTIPKNVDTVKEHIAVLVRNHTGLDLPIITTSVRHEDAADKIKELMLSFNTHELYDKHITAKLNMHVSCLIDDLETIRKNKDCNTEEIQEKIEQLEAAQKRFAAQIEKEKKNIGNQLRNAEGNIINKIDNQLKGNMLTLVSAYNEGGADQFRSRVVEIVRPVLFAELENCSNTAFEGFINHLNIISPDMQSDADSNDITNIVASVSDKLKQMQDNGAFVNLTKALSEKTSGGGSGNALYRGITSVLAIVTNVVNPLLEVLIVFLPDLFKIFSGGSEADDREDKLRDAINTTIIPDIKKQLKRELEKEIPQIELSMAEKAEASINEILESQKEALESLKAEKIAKEADYAAFIATIDQDIEILRR